MKNARTMIQKEQIEKAVAVLKAGGVILYPTDTIWGIGCDATNEAAVEKIFKIKQRSDSKSLIIRPLRPGDSGDGRHGRVSQRQTPHHHLS